MVKRSSASLDSKIGFNKLPTDIKSDMDLNNNEEHNYMRFDLEITDYGIGIPEDK
jgi:hypothetical protein